MGFFGKNSLFGKVSSKCAKFHSLILPIFFIFLLFFFCESYFPKSIKKNPGKKDAEM